MEDEFYFTTLLTIFPNIKVTGCLRVYVFVCSEGSSWTDMVILHIGSGKVYSYFWALTNLPIENFTHL